MPYSFKQVFISFLKELPLVFKDIEGELTEPSFIQNCLAYINDIECELFKEAGFEEVIEFNFSAIKDLIELKKELGSSDEVITILNYIQFFLTLKPLRHAIETGQHNLALRWVGYSFCDDLSDNQSKKFEIIRIDSYLSSTILGQIMELADLTQWVGDFYYICRRMSAYHNIADELFVCCTEISKTSLTYKKYEEFTWSYSCLIAWATSVKHIWADKLVSEVEQLIEDGNIPPVHCSQLILCLTTSANIHAKKSSSEWARILISDYSEHFKGHQKLQALIAIIVDDKSVAIDDIISEIRTEISHIKGEINKDTHHVPHTRQLLEQDRLFEMISPIYDQLTSASKISLAIQTLLDWYQITPGEELAIEHTLLLYPNGKDNLKIGCNEKLVDEERDITSTYSSLMETSNKFFGVSHSIRGIPDFKFWEHLPDRLGVPNADLSQELYDKLVTFYGLDLPHVIEFIQKNEKIESFICLPSKHHPIQYLLKRTTEKCWPLHTSLQRPNSDRTIIKVCLWSGAGSLTEQIETQSLMSLFQSINAEVTVFSSEETTKEKFVNIYESDEFDIIWVMSHGEYDHMRQGEVSVAIGDGEMLSLDEAIELSVPPSNERRLLFLNICDGATHSCTEGLERLGIAPALANRNQCVISHLWPVTAWSAASFGVIYSSKLQRVGNFFEAFEATLEVLANGNSAVLEYLSELEDHSQELRERLSYQNNDFDLIAHSGSAVFFQ